jgi:5-methylcytosine-specific restriction protein A
MINEPHERNRAWSRDELILALKLYSELKPKAPGENHEGVRELSSLLRAMRHKSGGDVPENFRSPASVVMKLMNFRSLDSEYDGKGLASVGDRDRLVWNELSADAQLLSALDAAIRSANATSEDSRPGVDPEFEDAFEGAILMKLHRVRERDPRLAKTKKEKALQEFGKLACEVCMFDFANFYGARGIGFIECHHILPLHELRAGVNTRLADLALVCANCHRMLHASRPVATISQLRSEVICS